MTNNLSDAEIIKVLERCSRDRALTTTDCRYECPYFNVVDCKRHCMRDALDFINRLKAENERLNNHIRDLTKKVKSEARKEFVERLKEKYKHNKTSVTSLVTLFENIDNLLKEMGCE